MYTPSLTDEAVFYFTAGTIPDSDARSSCLLWCRFQSRQELQPNSITIFSRNTAAASTLKRYGSAIIIQYLVPIINTFEIGPFGPQTACVHHINPGSGERQWQDQWPLLAGCMGKTQGLFQSLSDSLSASQGALTVNTAGAAVQGVVDEQITLHTEHTATWRTGEYLQTKRGGESRSMKTNRLILKLKWMNTIFTFLLVSHFYTVGGLMLDLVQGAEISWLFLVPIMSPTLSIMQLDRPSCLAKDHIF